MKKKYLSTLIGLILGLQSTFACGFCGQKNAACTYTTAYQIATTLAYILRGFSDVHGTNATEAYYTEDSQDFTEDPNNDDDENQGNANNEGQDNSDLLVNLDESKEEETDNLQESEDSGLTPQLVYIIPEVHLHQDDQNFMREVNAAAQNTQLIWAAEGIHYESQNDIPRPTEGLPAFGTEDPFANTLATFVTARSIFNFDSRNWNMIETQTYLVGELVDIIEAMIAPGNAAFMDAIVNDPQLRDNKMIQWVKRNKQALLKKSPQERNAFLRQAIMGKNGVIRQAQPWKTLLTRGMAILFGQCANLPQHLQMPERYLVQINNPAMIDLNVVTPILAYWRDLFIAVNLVRLSDYANEQGLPLVFVVGANHVDHINQLLGQVKRIQTTSDPSSLPLDSNVTSSKKKRFAKK